MNVYISVFIVIILICFFTKNKGDGKVALGVCITSIYLMISFQAGWGGDWETYNNLFDHYHGMPIRFALDDDSRWEAGFKVACCIMPSYTFMQFVFSAIYCIALYILFYHFIPKKWWAFGFLFLFFNRPLLMGSVATITRTGFAVSSFIIGLFFLAKDKKWIYVVLIIFASFFHRSALFFLPIVFIPLKKNTMNPMVALYILLGVLFVSFAIPTAWFDMVELVIGGVDTFAEYEEQLDGGTQGRSFGILLFFLFFWAYELFINTQKSRYSKHNYLVMYIGLIQIAFSFLPEVGLASRFYFYLNYAFFVGMIVILEQEKNEAVKWAIISTLIFNYGKSFMVFCHSPYFAENWLHYHTNF